MKVIEVRNLVKKFGDFVAVDNISFDCFSGEIFGFLGANGAGKTTAIKILCGLSKPSGGEVFVAGFNAKNESEKIKQNIGYMSQKFALYNDLSVWENIYYFGKIYKMSDNAIENQGEILLQKLNFSDKKNELVSRLPLGWKQKLAFCIANIHSPKIIFLDEPTGGVDPITRRQFWDLIYQAAATACIFVSTHYMDEAEYCSRVSIMVDEKIKALDSPNNLKANLGVKTMDEVFIAVTRGSK